MEKQSAQVSSLHCLIIFTRYTSVYHLTISYAKVCMFLYWIQAENNSYAVVQ